MRLKYSDYEPFELKAFTVGNQVGFADDFKVNGQPEVIGYGTPAEARAFAAEILKAAEEAERVQAEMAPCSICGGPREHDDDPWCDGCDTDARYADEGPA